MPAVVARIFCDDSQPISRTTRAVRVIADRPRECFAVADAALSKSGTTTLEAALAGAPQVIAYQVHPLTYVLARHLAKVPWIGLVNLVAGRLVAPEFVQGAATPAALAAALLPLLDVGSAERHDQLEGIAAMLRNLSTEGIVGPVGIGKVVMAATERGLPDTVYILMFISMALGFANLLPFPGLDGGRLVFLAYEVVTRRRPNERIEAAVHTVGIVFLLLVLILVTFRDTFG